MILQGFIGHAYRGTSPNVAVETLHNWYVQTVEATEPQQRVYYNRPGLTVAYTLTNTPVRGLFSQDDVVLAVGGQTLYQLNSDGTTTDRGAMVGLDTNPVTFSSSGTAGHQVYITSGGFGYIYDTNAMALSPIVAPAYPAHTPMGTYLDSYFLTVKGGTAQFNISGLLDGTAWAALDFAIRIAASDNLVGIMEFNKQIWLIGSLTSEPWFDSGAASFPYQSVPQVLIPIGCCAPFSIVRTTVAICWLHQSERGQGIFVAAEDYNPRRISTYAIEAIWKTYPTITDAVAYAMTWEGHEFIVLSFPSGNATWVYDVGEQSWTQWSYWNTATGHQDRYRGWVHCQAFNGHLVGDWQTGDIYSLSSTVATDGAEHPIIWERTAPHLKNELTMNFFANFQLDTETGLGGSTPTALLSWSDDGGHTFSSAIAMTMGAIGEYPTRCRAAGNLGQSRDRAFRVRISNNVPPRGVMAAYVDVTGGTS